MSEVFRPHYCRPPNRLLRYEERPFDDGHGHKGTERVAVFLDKHGKEQEAQAQIKWEDA